MLHPISDTKTYSLFRKQKELFHVTQELMSYLAVENQQLLSYHLQIKLHELLPTSQLHELLPMNSL